MFFTAPCVKIDMKYTWGPAWLMHICMYSNPHSFQELKSVTWLAVIHLRLWFICHAAQCCSPPSPGRSLLSYPSNSRSRIRVKMVILSLLSSGNGSLCPTTALQEETKGKRSHKRKNIKCHKNVDSFFPLKQQTGRSSYIYSTGLNS